MFGQYWRARAHVFRPSFIVGRSLPLFSLRRWRSEFRIFRLALGAFIAGVPLLGREGH